MTARRPRPPRSAHLQLRVDGQAQTLAGIEWKGLQRLTADQLRVLGRMPEAGPLTVEQATRGLRRLAHTELFAAITPTLRLTEGSAPTLEVTVEEHPFVSSVSFQGLQDASPRELREEMFRSVAWEPVRRRMATMKRWWPRCASPTTA